MQCGKNLAAKDSSGTSDPYVVIALLGADGRVIASKRTKDIGKTLNPVWNKLLTFSSEEAHAMHSMLVEVWDWDMMATDDFVGQVPITLSDIKKQQALQRIEKGRSYRDDLFCPFDNLPLKPKPEALGPASKMSAKDRAKAMDITGTVSLSIRFHTRAAADVSTPGLRSFCPCCCRLCQGSSPDEARSCGCIPSAHQNALSRCRLLHRRNPGPSPCRD